MKIQFLQDELWYGGAVSNGVRMPYDANSIATIDLIRGVFADQASPLFLSSKGRYIASRSPFCLTFNQGVIEIEAMGEIELSDGHGTLKGAQQAAARKYFDLSSDTPPLAFLKSAQYNTWIELMYNQNQKDILAYAHSLIDAGMKPGIFMIDEGWSPDYGDYDFDLRKFPDPQAMIDELHALGFKVMLWVTPNISPDGCAFREIRNKGYLLRDKDGKIALREWWNGFSCVLDLSNPACCLWFSKKLDGVIEKYDIEGFKFDAGNAYFYRADDQAFTVQTPLEHSRSFDLFCEQYCYNELRLVYDRAGAPLVNRLVDKPPVWDERGLKAIVPNTLMQGLLGYYYSCPDMIGGGVNSAFLADGFKVDEEMYLRWLEASVLCPMMQFSINPKRVLSAEGFEMVKKITALHDEYSHSILVLALLASRTGEPIVRMMEYEFPNEGMERVMDQFMLGSDILVAPVTEQGAVTRNVKLPAGQWKDRQGNVIAGGRTVNIPSPIGEMIILKKVG